MVLCTSSQCTGIPNFRLKLPSRNWLIFLFITGSWAAAITYDRRQKKAAQRKWCDLVADMAQQPLPTNQLARKLTIYLSAPPGDGIRPAREYFKEYIKPVLVAAAMDYDVIEGRREGEVRYGTAEQIRRFRRKRGEKGSQDVTEPNLDQNLADLREKMGIKPEPGVRGDLVIGRQTWKEYLRGLHEGWLGPLDEPAPPPAPETTAAVSSIHPPIDLTSRSTSGEDVISETVPSATEESNLKPAIDEPEVQNSVSISPDEKNKEARLPEGQKMEEVKKTPSTPHAYISTTAYATAPISAHIPPMLEPSAAIPHPHLLGFLKTPHRIYRYLNQRHLADDIGRRTAAIILAAHRPYHQSESFASTISDSPTNDRDTPSLATRDPGNTDTISPIPSSVVQTSQTWEQQHLLAEEEPTWHKSARAPRHDDVERVWLDDVVMDERVGARMRKFELDPAEEARASRIGAGVERGRAVEVSDLRKVPVIVGDVSGEEV